MCDPNHHCRQFQLTGYQFKRERSVTRWWEGIIFNKMLKNTIFLWFNFNELCVYWWVQLSHIHTVSPWTKSMVEMMGYVPKIPKYLKLLPPKFNQHICTYLLITSFTWSLQLKIFNRINTTVNLHVHKNYTGTTSPNYRIYSVRGRFSSGQHDTFYTETAVHLRQVLGYFPNEY